MSSSEEDDIMSYDLPAPDETIGSADESNVEDEHAAAGDDLSSSHEREEGDEPEVSEEETTVHEGVEDEEEHEEMNVKTTEDEEVAATPKSTSKKRPRSHGSVGGGSARRGRAPAVKGLTIPFRSVKRTMKLDKDIATVQNEAAIAATFAAELFLKSLAKESHSTAQSHGRNTIRYEDVAEARTKKPALAFLDTLIP